MNLDATVGRDLRARRERRLTERSPYRGTTKFHEKPLIQVR